MALTLILLGIVILLKYLFKNNKSNKIDTSLLDNIECDENNKTKKHDDISEVFSDKGSIFLMIGLFLFFIAIIIYISLGGFIK
ncbi:MAG: hypothetical protein ACLUCH_04400 [Lachnospirales bacterium]|nr:hypothetical protein [Clostridiales bacterium]